MPPSGVYPTGPTPGNYGPPQGYPGQPAWEYPQQASYQQYAQYQQQPGIYTVRVVRHTGAIIFWSQQTRTVTGTYPQCLAALRDGQVRDLALGWWSLASIVLFNLLALAANRSSRKKLNQAATHDGWSTSQGQPPTGPPPGQQW